MKFSEFCKFQEGYVNPSQKKSEYFDGNIKWLRATDLNNANVYTTSRMLTEVGFKSAGKSALLFEPNTIAISKSGTIGRVGILKDYMCGNRAVINIKVDENLVNLKYLFYWLINNNKYIQDLAVGSVQKNLYVSILSELEIEDINIEEQKKIADILSSLDNKIELNNDMNKTLEEMAQSIFKRWFVDFEFPNKDGEPYKSSGGEMVDSELGMIPKGWEVKSLDKIADFLNGLAMQKFRPKEDELEFLPVLKIKELKQGSTSKDSDRCSCNIDSKYIIDDGDIIFAWSGSLDVRVWCGGKAGLNQHLFKVTSKDYPKWFYYLWVKRYLDDFIRIAADRATTMGHIKRSNLTEAKVLIPDNNTLCNMEKKIGYLVDLFIEKSIESKELGEIRDTLLPKLMSGEIKLT